jgi:hypothetical protein
VLALCTFNPDTVPLTVTQGLHSYFRVGDVRRVLARLSQLAHRFRGFPRFHLRNALICLSTAGAMGL